MRTVVSKTEENGAPASRKSSLALALFAEFSLQDVNRPSIHRSLADHILWLIARGRLSPGDPLPAAGSLGSELGVDRATVHAAYNALVVMGVLVRRRNLPPVVIDAEKPMHHLSERLRVTMQRVAREAKALGWKRRDLTKLLG
jgi:DNA-binding transcriptional regulator YhcF (GntR family)